MWRKVLVKRRFKVLLLTFQTTTTTPEYHVNTRRILQTKAEFCVYELAKYGIIITTPLRSWATSNRSPLDIDKIILGISILNTLFRIYLDETLLFQSVVNDGRPPFCENRKMCQWQVLALPYQAQKCNIIQNTTDRLWWRTSFTAFAWPLSQPYSMFIQEAAVKKGILAPAAASPQPWSTKPR